MRVAAVALLALTGVAVAQTAGATTTAAGVGRYVALGNSYSSGDGAFDAKGNAHYIRSTNQPNVDMCHRSTNAFPFLLSKSPKLGVSAQAFAFSACAEARVANFLKTFPSFGDWGEGPQLNAIAPAKSPSSTTGLVTVTIGGTDVGLYADVLSCVHPKGRGAGLCAQTVNGRLVAGLKLLRTGGRVKYNLNSPSNWVRCPTCSPTSPGVVDVPPLPTLFKDVAQRAPKARILVLGYPMLVPQGATATCQVGTVTRSNGAVVQMVLEGADIAFITKVVLQLNQVIQESVNAAHTAGVNVAYVSAFGTFRGHGPCDAASPSQLYLNPIKFLGGGAAISPASLHPNALGQTAFANLVLQRL